MSIPWDIHFDDAAVLWRGRRLRVHATLVNRASVSCIPEPRRLRPILRDIQGAALATSDLWRLEHGNLTLFRPVVPPDGAVQICLQFERLPPDRAPCLITFGDLGQRSVFLPSDAEPAVAPPSAAT